MKILSGKLVATSGLLALLAIAGNFAQAQMTAKPSSQPMAMAPADTAQLQATSDKAAAKIEATASDKKLLLEAVRTNNIEQIRAVLLRNGFSPKQIEAIKITPKDTTGGHGAPEKIKITIRVSCCPMNITITISF
jgi:hypothetical protein